MLAQERSTERLYEEELEVVWDKGSSGLVFYTDASYWDQQEGGIIMTYIMTSYIHSTVIMLNITKLYENTKQTYSVPMWLSCSHALLSQFLCTIHVTVDFDEKCSKEDDWDVDMSAYYDYGECIS